MEEWEKNYILENIQLLCSVTKFSASLLARLQSTDLLREGEIKAIKSSSDEQAKVLYQLLVSSPSSSLMAVQKALIDEKLIIAANILSQCMAKPQWESTLSGSIIYNPNTIIGTGRFNPAKSRTFAGVLLPKRIVAVKKIVMKSESESLYKEAIQLLDELKNHENVVHYEKVELNGRALFVAMELCTCSAESYLDSIIQVLTIKEILWQTAVGLSFLHNNFVIHGNIKPNNILVYVYDKYTHTIKISDYGFGDCGDLERYVQQPLSWTAPEILKERLSNDRNYIVSPWKGSFATDVFSLGCVFYYFMSKGIHPFGTGLICEFNICNGQPNLDPNRLHINARERSRATSFVLRMLQRNEKLRPLSNAVVMDSYFDSLNPYFKTDWAIKLDFGNKTISEDVLPLIETKILRGLYRADKNIIIREQICHHLSQFNFKNLEIMPALLETLRQTPFKLPGFPFKHDSRLEDFILGLKQMNEEDMKLCLECLCNLTHLEDIRREVRRAFVMHFPNCLIPFEPWAKYASRIPASVDYIGGEVTNAKRIQVLESKNSSQQLKSQKRRNTDEQENIPKLTASMPQEISGTSYDKTDSRPTPMPPLRFQRHFVIRQANLSNDGFIPDIFPKLPSRPRFALLGFLTVILSLEKDFLMIFMCAEYYNYYIEGLPPLPIPYMIINIMMLAEMMGLGQEQIDNVEFFLQFGYCAVPHLIVFVVSIMLSHFVISFLV